MMAEELIARIERGEREFTDVTIIGDVHLDDMTLNGLYFRLSGEITGNLYMDSTVVEGSLHLDIQVGRNLSLVDTKIKDLLFLGGIVKGDLLLEDAQLDKGAELHTLRIGGDVILDGATIEETLSLERFSVNGAFSLLNAQKIRSLTLGDTQIGGEVICNGNLALAIQFFLYLGRGVIADPEDIKKFLGE